MKNCPDCFAPVEDSATKCPNCGKEFSDDTQKNNSSASFEAEVPAADASKKSKKPLIIAIIIAAVLLVAGGVLLALDATEVIDFINIIDNTEDEKDNISKEEDKTDEEGTSKEESVLTPEEGAGTSIPNDEITTADTEEQTTDSAEEPSSSTTVTPPPSGGNEYDILRSGTCYMIGSMVDSMGIDAPMEMAMAPGVMFMLSDFEGIQMGMIIKEDSIYMLYADKKAYMKLGESEMSLMGMSMSDFDMSADIDFASLPDLSEASKTSEATHNGHNCTVYHLVSSDGLEKRVYMDGNELIRVAEFSSGGTFISSIDIDEITAQIPEGKTEPPSDYSEYNMFSFFLLLEDLMV